MPPPASAVTRRNERRSRTVLAMVVLRYSRAPMLAPAILLAILAVGTNVFADALARVAFGGERGEETAAVTALELTTS